MVYGRKYHTTDMQSADDGVAGPADVPTRRSASWFKGPLSRPPRTTTT